MAEHFKILWRRGRRLQVLPELNQYPATPPAFYTGYYPAATPVESNRVAFTVRLQTTPEPNVYPPTPVPVEYTAVFTPEFTPTGNRTNRAHQTVEQAVYPVTPVITAGGYPAWSAETANTTAHVVRLQVLPEHNVYPATPVVDPTGYFPGSALTTANRIRRKVRHLTAPGLNAYPAPVPVPEQPVTAYMTAPVVAVRQQRRHIQTLELDEFLPSFINRAIYFETSIAPRVLLSTDVAPRIELQTAVRPR